MHSNGSEMSPEGRRLLASLRNVFGLNLSDEAAAASGMALGIVSGRLSCSLFPPVLLITASCAESGRSVCMCFLPCWVQSAIVRPATPSHPCLPPIPAGLATGVAATVITGIAMAALPGVGLAAGVLIGAGVAFIAQKSLDDIVTEAVDFFEDDTTVMQGFQQGHAIGGLGSAVLTPVTGLPKLDLFLGKTGVVKVFKGWRSEAELVRGANWKVTKATWKALATQANPAATEQQIAAAWRSESAYRGWATRRANTARANSAKYLSDSMQDSIGAGISAYQEYEALRKLATLGQSEHRLWLLPVFCLQFWPTRDVPHMSCFVTAVAEGECVIAPHTFFNVWPEMKLIAHVQDVESGGCTPWGGRPHDVSSTAGKQCVETSSMHETLGEVQPCARLSMCVANLQKLCS